MLLWCHAAFLQLSFLIVNNSLDHAFIWSHNCSSVYLLSHYYSTDRFWRPSVLPSVRPSAQLSFYPNDHSCPEHLGKPLFSFNWQFDANKRRGKKGGGEWNIINWWRTTINLVVIRIFLINYFFICYYYVSSVSWSFTQTFTCTSVYPSGYCSFLTGRFWCPSVHRPNCYFTPIIALDLNTQVSCYFFINS